MNQRTKVAGVILAGGRARRMAHRDKGLVEFRGRPLVSYANEVLSAVAGRTVISANRNFDLYRQFGIEIVADQSPGFDGPLAGILAAMAFVEADILLVVPCDSPLIKEEHLRRLLMARDAVDADAAIAFDGKRLHPVFLALKTTLIKNLQDYLNSGQRKVEDWLKQNHTVLVDFSDMPEIFININTLSELSELEGNAKWN